MTDDTRPEMRLTTPTPAMRAKILDPETTHVVISGHERGNGEVDGEFVCAGTERECDEEQGIRGVGFQICLTGFKPVSYMYPVDEFRVLLEGEADEVRR